MADIYVSTLRVSELVTNCYICMNKDTKESFIVDPGDDADRIVMQLDRLEAKPVAILLTHGHFDHIGAAGELKKKYDIPVIASAAEEKVLTDPNVNLSGMFGSSCILRADRYLNDGDEFECAGINIRMILTPGHTCGSCCYYLYDNGTLFSGDTLFCASRGRTDFPTGSERAIMNSIRNKLLILPGDTDVLAGHMESTTIADERAYN